MMKMLNEIKADLNKWKERRDSIPEGSQFDSEYDRCDSMVRKYRKELIEFKRENNIK